MIEEAVEIGEEAEDEQEFEEEEEGEEEVNFICSSHLPTESAALFYTLTTILNVTTCKHFRRSPST